MDHVTTPSSSYNDIIMAVEKSFEIIDMGYEHYMKELEQNDYEYVDVGILAKDGAKQSKKRTGGRGNLTLAQKAYINEFGAVIKHPGGTDYGYKSKAGAERGEIRFLKKGTGFVTGTTGEHDIVIPPRPFLRQTLEENKEELFKRANELELEVLTKKSTIREALITLGKEHQDQITLAMKTKGKFEPNKKSTIKRKGSTTPLIETGQLRSSISYGVGRAK